MCAVHRPRGCTQTHAVPRADVAGGVVSQAMLRTSRPDASHAVLFQYRTDQTRVDMLGDNICQGVVETLRWVRAAGQQRGHRRRVLRCALGAWRAWGSGIAGLTQLLLRAAGQQREHRRRVCAVLRER